MGLSVVPGSAEQQAAFVGAGDAIPMESASIAMAALPGFTMPALWGAYTPPRYLVKRMLSPAQVTVLFGESGHFKSVIAIDLALCVASGSDFHSVKTQKAGVLYVAGEGHGGLRKRVRAWLLSHGLSAESEQPALYVTEQGADLIGNPLQLKATVNHAAIVLGAPIALVVIDTLAANFGEGDENHAGDMQTAVRNARAAAQDASVLLLHHTGHGKEGGARERGSYALRATADCRLRAVYDEPSKLIELQSLRVKDDEESAPMFFAWRKVELGWKDEDGEELTSVVLERSKDAPPAGSTPSARAGNAGLGANQETVLKVLRRLYRQVQSNLEEQQRDPAEGKVLISGLRNAIKDGRYMPPPRLTEAMKALADRGLIRVEEPHVYLNEEP